MRLIDADALKKAIEKSEPCCDAWIGIIDNAPDAPLDHVILYVTRRNGKQQQILNAVRPKGEWIEVEPHQSDLDDGITYREECSVCHEPNRHYGFDEYHDIRFATYYKTKFCPHCGAKMQTSD